MARKKRATISRTEALRRIEEILPLLDENVHIAMSVEAALEAANEFVRSRRPITSYAAIPTTP
jgi:hypothetical protein